MLLIPIGQKDNVVQRLPWVSFVLIGLCFLVFTALSVTREIERGTMESLLAMPITPVEIMLGKIIPYIIVGFVQAALIITIGIGLFGVPLLGIFGFLLAGFLGIGLLISILRSGRW